MFEGLQFFFDLFDVSPVWPIVILVGLILLCIVPYKPVYKIKETKDKDGSTIYKIWKNRD